MTVYEDGPLPEPLRDLPVEHVFAFCDWCGSFKPAASEFHPVHVRGSDGCEHHYVCGSCLDQGYETAATDHKKLQRRYREAARKRTESRAKKKKNKKAVKTKGKSRKR